MTLLWAVFISGFCEGWGQVREVNCRGGYVCTSFFVWAWPSGFCIEAVTLGEIVHEEALFGRRQKGGSTSRMLIPASGLCLSAMISRVVWAWPDPLPARLKRIEKNVQILWWAELDRLHSMTSAHPPRVNCK